MKTFSKPFIFVLVLLLLAVGASAAQTVQNNFYTSSPSLTIVYPKYEFYPEQTDVILNFDVLNSSYSRLDNTTATCLFVAVDGTGHPVIYDNLSYSSYWYHPLNTTYTKIGKYNYYVHCKDLLEEGYVSGSFKVTADGEEERSNNAADATVPLAVVIFILAITGVLFALPLVIPKFAENKYADLVLKRCCWLIAIYLMTLNSAIMATLVSFAGINLTSEMFRYLWLFAWGGYVFMIFLVFKTFTDTLAMWKLDKHNKRMGDDD